MKFCKISYILLKKNSNMYKIICCHLLPNVLLCNIFNDMQVVFCM